MTLRKKARKRIARLLSFKALISIAIDDILGNLNQGATSLRSSSRVIAAGPAEALAVEGQEVKLIFPKDALKEFNAEGMVGLRLPQEGHAILRIS